MYCKNCGKKLGENEIICADCAKKNINEFAHNASKEINKIMNTKDETKNYEKNDIENGIFMGILAYISFLVLIPYFTCKDSKYVTFHTKQGLNLFIYELIGTVVGYILGRLFNGLFLITFPFWLLGILFLIISIIGIVNVINGKAKELPIIDNIKIIK